MVSSTSFVIVRVHLKQSRELFGQQHPVDLGLVVEGRRRRRHSVRPPHGTDELLRLLLEGRRHRVDRRGTVRCRGIAGVLGLRRIGRVAGDAGPGSPRAAPRSAGASAARSDPSADAATSAGAGSSPGGCSDVRGLPVGAVDASGTRRVSRGAALLGDQERLLHLIDEDPRPRAGLGDGECRVGAPLDVGPDLVGELDEAPVGLAERDELEPRRLGEALVVVGKAPSTSPSLDRMRAPDTPLTLTAIRCASAE